MMIDDGDAAGVGNHPLHDIERVGEIGENKRSPVHIRWWFPVNARVVIKVAAVPFPHGPCGTETVLATAVIDKKRLHGEIPLFMLCILSLDACLINAAGA
jgi:hypothetical protein